MELNLGDYVYIKPVGPEAGEQYVYSGCHTTVLAVAVDGWCQLNVDDMENNWHPDDLEKQLPIGTRVRAGSEGFVGYPDFTGVIVDVENAHDGSPFGFWYSVQMDWLPQPFRLESNTVVPIDQDDSTAVDHGDTDGDRITAEDLEPILFS